MFVLLIYHFWMRNRQILNFEHFELFFARFYSVKRAFSTKWWPSEENAPKIIFFCIFGLLLYKYKIYQVGWEFRQLFDILVHPTIPILRMVSFRFPSLWHLKHIFVTPRLFSGLLSSFSTGRRFSIVFDDGMIKGWKRFSGFS